MNNDWWLYKNYLMHHGIDGQKWGVRNGPPYPLSKETHQKVVRSGYVRDRQNAAKGKVNINKTQASYHYMNRLDHDWKEVINASDLPEGLNAADVLDKNNDYWTTLEKGMTINKIRDVNWGWGEAGTTNNCKKCTTALELRRRGIDVFAGRSFEGGLIGATSYWWDGAVQYKEKGEENYFNRISKVLGNNGTCEITMQYPTGGGHSMYGYQAKDGFHVADGQTGDDYCYGDVNSTMSKVVEKYGFDTTDKWATVTRLDTCTPNYKHMSEDSVIRKNYVNDSMNQMMSRKTGKYGRIYDTREGDATTEHRQSVLNLDDRRKVGDYGYYLSDTPLSTGANFDRSHGNYWRYRRSYE